MCVVASLPDYRSAVVISHRHKSKYRSSIAISISLLLPPPVIHPNPPIRAEQIDHLGRLGHRSSPFPRTSHCPSGRVVFDEVDTQLPHHCCRCCCCCGGGGGWRGRADDGQTPRSTREVPSGVQRLSRLACSLAVLSFTYWCGARQTAVNRQPVNAVPSTKQRSIARRGALRQGGPGTRDQESGTRAVRGASFIMSIGARLVWPKDEPHHGASTPAATVPPHSQPVSSCEMFQTS